MSFFTALRFLTVFRIPGGRTETADDMGRSTIWFPAIGLIIGAILALTNWVFSLFLPAIVTSSLTIVILVIITGAMHLDGFADTCDGLAGNKPAEERWKVMHDSRTGAFGVAGLILLLLVKFALLNSIPQTFISSVLVVMPVIGRWSMVYAIAMYPYARNEGLGKAFKDGVTLTRLVIATLITLGLSIVLAWWADVDYYYIVGFGVMVVIWILIVAVSAYFRRKFVGLTGDTYGAINELAETGVLLIGSIACFNGWVL
ncbi:MAG: adenosylcobinamide-GDP ribazoletransferase [Dehalococcoidales bacterium]|nr:MAG: adenosylcobinamide-GDP ribazoletransferase [Dehalococcoidales bacterium]